MKFTTLLMIAIAGVFALSFGVTDAQETQPPVPFVIKQNPLPEFTVAEKARGYVVYSDHYQRPLFDVSVPSREQVVSELVCNAARGEYESIQVGVFAMRNLSNLKIEVDLDLPVKVYRYVTIDREIPVVTMRNDTELHKKTTAKMPYFLYPQPVYKQAASGRTSGFWITVEAPEDATPGEHVGTITISADKARVLELPLKVNVRSFVLPKPKIAFGIYYDPEGRINGEYVGPQWEKMYYADMAAHGMNSVTIYDDVHKLLNRDGTWNENEVVAKIGRMREAGLVDGSQPLFIITGYWDALSSDGPDVVAASFEQLQAIRAAHDLPEIYIYSFDEPGGPYEPKIAAIQPWLDMGAKMITAMHHQSAYDNLGPYHVATLVNAHSLGLRAKQSIENTGGEFWTYDCNCHGFTTKWARTYPGFVSWNAGVKGNFLWAYTHASWEGKDHYTLDENGEVVMHLLRWYARAAPGPEGPLPSVGWESTREGIDDYRYLQLLDELAKSPDVEDALAEEIHAWFEALALHKFNWEQTEGRYRGFMPNNDSFDMTDFFDPWPEKKAEDYDQLREEAAAFIERLSQ